MIIYQNGLIILDYSPATDILSVELPSVIDFGLSELERALEIVAENIVIYDIKCLLLDSSKVRVEHIEDDAYKGLVGQFIMKLVKTRIRSIARVNSYVQVHDERVVRVTNEKLEALGSSILFRAFATREHAQAWLTGSLE